MGRTLPPVQRSDRWSAHTVSVVSWRTQTALPDPIFAHDQLTLAALHLARGGGGDLGADVLGGPQRGIAVHESDAAGVRADVDGSEVSIRRNDADALQLATEGFGGDLRDHGVRPLADVTGAGVDDHAPVAIDLDVDGGVWHVRTDDAVSGTADVVAAADAQSALHRAGSDVFLGVIDLAARPFGGDGHLLDAFRQAVTLH